MTPTFKDRPSNGSSRTLLVGGLFAGLLALLLLAWPWWTAPDLDQPDPGGPPAVAFDATTPAMPNDPSVSSPLPSGATTGETTNGPRTPQPTIAELCRRIGDKLSSVSPAECLALDLRDTDASSVLGTPLVAADFAPSGHLGAKVLLLGGIHGDEYSSVTIVFKWMAAMEAAPPSTLRWRMLPLLNPDGLLREKSQRMNHNGVDLNRNFPTPDWQRETADYWVRRTGRNPRRYPGPSPLSEPESRFLHHEIERFQPDIIVAVHAPLEVVDFDGPRVPPDKLGSLFLQRMGTYPGSLGRYGGEQIGVPVITIELPSATIMPPADEQGRIWSDLHDYIERTLCQGEAETPTTAE